MPHALLVPPRRLPMGLDGGPPQGPPNAHSAAIAFEFGGIVNASRTCRDPHRGHLRRLSNRASGKSRPRVQTSVCRSSCPPCTHSRTRFIPSRGPCAQRTVTRHPREKASPSVSIDMRTFREQDCLLSRTVDILPLWLRRGIHNLIGRVPFAPQPEGQHHEQQQSKAGLSN